MKLGIFDSGIGGLSVANSLVGKNPNIELVYVADSKYLPYGSQAKDVINERVEKIVKFLLGEGCDHIICACNTAFAVSEKLLNIYKSKVRISNITESFAQSISKGKKDQEWVLFATENTISSGVYNRFLGSNETHSNVKNIKAGQLVILIENGAPSKTISQVLTQYKRTHNIGIQAIVLGCTHYNWALPEFKEVFESNKIYSSQHMLDHVIQQESPKANFGTLRFYDTGDSSQMQEKVLEEYCSYVRELKL